MQITLDNGQKEISFGAQEKPQDRTNRIAKRKATAIQKQQQQQQSELKENRRKQNKALKSFV